MLTGPLFMLQVYDRVLPSRSVPTLLGLGVLAAALYAFQGGLDWLRGRILVRIGMALDESLSRDVYLALVRRPLRSRSSADALQPLRDLDQVRGFLAGAGPMALFDFPWMPFYLMICYLFHPLIGLVTTAGALILVTLTALTEILTRQPAAAAAQSLALRNALAAESHRNAEVMQAMGMADRVGALWGTVNARYMRSQRLVSDYAGGFGSASKVLRFGLQSGVLGLGAWLVIQQEVTAGVMIACSILTSRALAPVELAIAHWRGFVAARQGWQRLRDLLAPANLLEQAVDLPAPKKMLAVGALSIVPPGARNVVVQDVSFTVKAGSALGVIGPSGSGKSSLARALVGAWRSVRGTVRLDGAALEQWNGAALGRHVGYLPQDVELFDGTIAENIARFDPDASSEAVLAAAAQANVHDLIVSLADGYRTRIGRGGTMLSAGQRQRVALARALYGDPFLVVLDEPSSNLDAEGDEALTKAILQLRARGGVAVVIVHRPSALAAIDQLMVIKQGRVMDFGPKDDVMGRLSQRPPATAAPAAQLRVVPDGAGRAS